MATFTLTGDYGYKEYWVKNASGTIINATNADWHIAARETVPTFNIFDSRGVIVDGGEIWGNISQTADWRIAYNHYATAFRVSNSPNTTIRNVSIDGTWDGIRFIPDDSLKVAYGTSNGWLVEDVYMHNIRDDAIENDFAHTGTLRDSLLDGVFSGFGVVNDQSAHGVLTVDDSIIVMKDYLKDGVMTHGTPFKFNTENPENNPELRIVNSIIAVQDPTHNGRARLSEAWDHLTVSSGNYYLNLSDTPFPKSYPLPPKGFTILQGEAARDFLAQQKAQWLAEHDGPQSPTTPTPIPDPTPDLTPDPTPTPTPTPTPSPTPTTGTTWGRIWDGWDNPYDSGGDYRLLANSGGDYLYNRAGVELIGGGETDGSVSYSRFDGTLDEILNFNSMGDIYLDNATVTNLGSGSLSSSGSWSINLEDGATARIADSNDLVAYDGHGGSLSFGADVIGSGSFTNLQNHMDFAALNIV